MNRIKLLRERLGWTQDDLGDKLNVKRSAVSKYENESNSISHDTLKQLASIFNVSIDYILCLTDDQTPIRDVDADLDAERDFDAEIRELLKDEEGLVAFKDYAMMDDDSKKNIIQYIKFLKSQNEKK